jgi:glutathione S-transferase
MPRHVASTLSTFIILHHRLFIIPTAFSQPDIMATSADSTTKLPAEASANVPTLHHLSSSQSLRVLWALEELCIIDPSFNYNLVLYPRKQGRSPPELKKLHPLGHSPVLAIPQASSAAFASPLPGSTTEQTLLTESRLILQHLSDTYANGAWKAEGAEAQLLENWLQEFANASLGPRSSTPMVFELVPAFSPFYVRPVLSAVFTPIAKMMVKDLRKHFAVLEEILGRGAGAETGGREWFGGAKLGVSDFCLSWPMDLCQQRGFFDGEKFPRLKSWLDRVHARPAYVKAQEKGGSYNLVTFDY